LFNEIANCGKHNGLFLRNVYTREDSCLCTVFVPRTAVCLQLYLPVLDDQKYMEELTTGVNKCKFKNWKEVKEQS
jgi:hypothetical protein